MPGFESVAKAFDTNFSEGSEIGAAFAAYVDGRQVVDLWGGLADRRNGVAWRSDTLVGVFSGTKGLVATSLALLIDRGLLDINTPVCRYWPEFAAKGKDAVLVRDVVSHQAGLPGLLTPVTIEEATDDVHMAELLAAQLPNGAARARLEYHAMTFGWLCGELVRRVDGRSVGRFLAEEIAEPLGLEVWIGLPERYEGRVAVLERDSAFAREQTKFAVSREANERAWSVWSNPPRFTGGKLAANLRSWRAAEIPATGGVVSARSLARLYGCLARGGDLDGVQLLSPATLELSRGCLVRGRDPIIDEPLAFGVGFELQTAEMRFGNPYDAFGHSGAGGSIHGAWPSLRTGFSYAPNLLASFSGENSRPTGILCALHEAVTGAAA